MCHCVKLLHQVHSWLKAFKKNMVQEFSFNGLLLQLRIVSLSVAYCFSEIVLNIDYMAIFCVFTTMWSWWLTTVWKAIYYSACELWSVWSNVVAGKYSFLKELNFWFGLDLVSIVMATDLSIHWAVPVDMHFYEYSPSLYSCASSPLDRTTQAKLLLIFNHTANQVTGYNHFWCASETPVWAMEYNTDVETQQDNANHSQP